MNTASKPDVVILSSVHSALDVRIFYKQARSLADAGYKVTLIARHDKNEIKDKVNIIGLSMPKNRFQRMIAQTFRAFRLALNQNAVVYHFHDPELIPIGLILKFLGKKVIYDVHEDYQASIYTKDWLPSLIRTTVSNLFDWLEKKSSQKFNYIITATDHISKRFGNIKNIVLHNYPIIENGNNEFGCQKSKGEYTIIYAGGLARIRGIREIAESIGHINDRLHVKLKLLGKFSDRDFETQIRSLAEFDKIELSYVPYTEVFSHLLSAHVGLAMFHPVPNHIDSMPNKLFEYMSAGLPIIASDFPLWKQIVEGNKCGITVDPMNPKAIAEAIEYLLERPELMNEMGENGRKAVLEKYSWQKESEKLIKIYSDILNVK
ncbi:TPA: glycosyltransferase [bacterium]|nr:glycosyltransferase [bacterium]